MTILFEFRLDDADRDTYGGPEWTVFDMDKVVDLPVDLLEQVEDATGYTLLVGFPDALGRGSLKAVRAAVWLARHCAGIHEPTFEQFKPNMLKATTRDPEPAVDAVPPVNRAARRTPPRKTPPTKPRSGS